MNSSACPVLVIGLDALDWNLLSTKIAQGELPHLASLVEKGTSGPLRSIHPLFSPALWSTIATGKRPYKHNITGFTLPDDAGTGLKSYDSTSRSSPAFWNILSSEEANRRRSKNLLSTEATQQYRLKKGSRIKSHIIGWWTTSPAEQIQGTLVDETFRIARHPCNEPWPVAENSVSPAVLGEKLKKCRVHPQKIPESLLRELVPKLYEIDPSSDLRISGFAKILAEDLTSLETTLYLMSQRDWDCTSVYLIGLDSLSHQGMMYREPALEGINPLDKELYGELVDRAYQLYDRWIGKLITAAGTETNIILLSDHGFYHDHRKPKTIGIEATAPCAHHTPIGTLIMAGPGIKKNNHIQHASILDICPTLLTLLDLPAGRDMPGNILQQAFTFSRVIQRIASWDHYCAAAPTLTKPSSETTEAALIQLVALGYLQELPTNKQEAIKEAQASQLLHRALAYLSDEQFQQAINLLEKARIEAPERTEILAELANAYLLINQNRRAAANFKQLVRCRYRDARRSWKVLEKKINPSTKPSISENWALRRLLARAYVDEDGMNFTIALANWIAHHKTTDLHLLILLTERHPDDFFMALNTGQACLSSQREKQGLALLRQAASRKLEEAEPLAIMAEYENKNKNFLKAESLAREALHRNPLSTASWLTLAISLTAQQRWEEARNAALKSTHSSLRKSKACNILAEIALNEKNDPILAARYQKISKRAEKRFKNCFLSHQQQEENLSILKASPFSQKFIFNHGVTPPATPPFCLQHSIVVTGLPRSGTSLLMQMLAAGGREIFTDKHRCSDEHNPRGYFEHEKIKNIANDATLLKEIEGKVVKIVIPLLWELPKKFQGSILWIRRDLQEVILSQERMTGLKKTHEALLTAYHYYEAKTFEIIQRHNWRVLELSHKAILADPKKEALIINDFLGGLLNKERMAHAIEPKLYRTRQFA